MPKLTTRLIEGLKPKEKPYEVVDEGPGAISGFKVRVNPGGRMTYLVRYRIHGKPENHTIGGVGALPLVRAREEAQRLRVQAKEHELGRAASPKPERKPKTEPHTIGSWVEGPYSKVLKHKKSGQATLERIRTVFKGKIWGMRIDHPDLLRAVIEWRQARQDAGRMHSTINRDCTALRAALSHAVELSVLEVHPLQRLKPLKEPRENRVRYLTDDEETRLFHALEARAERLRAERDSGNAWRRERDMVERLNLRTVRYVDFIEPAIVLMLHTGMRRGECFALRWDDIDFDARVLTVRASGTKSGTARRIPMNRTVQDTLHAWRPRSGDDLVFPSPRSGGLLQDVKKSWGGLMKAADIKGFRLHDLRHTFASRLVQRGVPLNTVRELLGHASMQMTLRYAHLAPEQGHDAVATLDRPRGDIVPFPTSPRKTDGGT